MCQQVDKSTTIDDILTESLNFLLRIAMSDAWATKQPGWKVRWRNMFHEDDRRFKERGIINRHSINQLCLESGFLIERFDYVGQTCPKSEFSDSRTSRSCSRVVTYILEANEIQLPDDVPSTPHNDSSRRPFGKFRHTITENNIVRNVCEGIIDVGGTV